MAEKMLLASGNKGKINEFHDILSEIGFTVEGRAADIEETGGTFEENASLKALYLSAKYDGFVMADDSGISVCALDGAPGVRSARYAGENAGDEDNNALLLKNMENIENRAAKFVCVIALAKDGEIIGLFRGECEGSLAHSPRGTGGFGYDPLFLLPDGRTMAELSSGEKNSISHRKKAAEKLLGYLKSLS